MKSVMDVYGEIAKKNDVWTAEEEKESFKLWKKDREAWVDLAMRHNLSMVFSYVKKNCYMKDKEDVFQEALTQMVQALRTFDPKKGYRVSTWISRKVLWGVYQAQDPASHNGTIAEELASVNRIRGRHFSTVSMDSTVGDDEDSATLASVISKESVNPAYADARGYKSEAEIQKEAEVKDAVANLITKMSEFLTQRECFVVAGIFQGRTMADIGVEMKVSKMRISQITAAAFGKIRTSKYASYLKSLVK